jgi:S-adenosylmethionine:tRNA ribosyltransferase-isomerase
MRTEEFDFHLPADRIARRPARPRDSARLLHVGPKLGDLGMRDLPGLLRPGDILVFNDTRVIPAQLEGRRGAARVSVTLHKAEEQPVWRAFARPAKRLRPGDRVDFAPGFSAEVLDRNEGEVTLRFDRGGPELAQALRSHGRMPLPPYIPRPEGPDASDSEDYQTMFAARDGAVAAPTASLHFTPELVDAVRARGVATATLTLHVGAGTFLPVKTEEVEGHRMHVEYGEISPDTAAVVNEARMKGGRVIAAGTTVTRLLETAAAADGTLKPFQGDTDIFITPGYRFKIVDLLLTNFHLPRSTLFMLVCAFAGTDRMKQAYAHAIASGYRFYSYGDGCLLEPSP